MLAVTHNEIGAPEQVLYAREQATPTPKAGEALIRMVLSPIHNHDLMKIAGNYGELPQLPGRPGTEAMGIVEAIGEGVKNLSMGQRITAAGNFHTWADKFVAPAAALVPLPDDIDDALGAQLLSMPRSAMMMLDDLGVRSGEWLMLNAASGAVGKNLAMLGRDMGVKIVSLVSHPDSLEQVRKLGVEIAVNIQDAGWEDAVRQGLGGEQILYGLDSVGGSLSGAMLKLMGTGSTLVSFGALSNEPLVIDYKDLIFKQATVRGFWMARVGATLTDERKARMVQDLIEIARKGGLRLPVAQVFDLKDIAAAAAASKVSRSGKIMLRGAE